MMYGESGYNGHSENIGLNGMNVWIYPPPASAKIQNLCSTNGGKAMSASDFSNGKMWDFELVRRVAKGTTWHPATDKLRGTSSYGNAPTDPVNGATGTKQWNYNQVEYFMFSTGDFSEWMIIKRDILDTEFGSNKAQPIQCSSDYKTETSYNQYFRSGVGEDPWLSYHHHGTSSMMYGESGYNGHSENIGLNGMNVWIYPPQG